MNTTSTEGKNTEALIPSTRTFTYTPSGVCVKRIDITIDNDGIVTDVEFTGGCKGNLNVIKNLMIGKHYNWYYNLFRNNKCGNRPTSCADQLADLLDLIKEDMTK